MKRTNIPKKYKWKVARDDGSGTWDYYETKARAKKLGLSNIIRKRDLRSKIKRRCKR